MFLSQDYCSTSTGFPLEVQGYLTANEVPKWSMVEEPQALAGFRLNAGVLLSSRKLLARV